ncbi:YiiD C-terminal domain-containing protein [Scleromatobacter humisilvae]|uniref:Thioesterase domain-containing protein n=1 Tax=Scleromatobacter humisilvae TaxID=2897159 RepID=A0A9X1YLY7_9BURK|nr:YiiD C-terminal domain-containing protein [Scleromatobacter humisilvae]MCK9688769.1 thioesterase domain-containing protein [Scleromatobacter humisilvae]
MPADAMTASELETYLHAHIPLSAAMQVGVLAVDADGVTLRAPLAPNINHRDTVFGGSASAVAILAAWSLLHTRLRAEGVAARLVIQGNSMEYLQPIAGDFTARSALAEPEQFPRFLHTLARMRRARLRVTAQLETDGRIAARFAGEFVALAMTAP